MTRTGRSTLARPALAVVCGLLLAFSLTACGGDDEGATGSPADTASPESTGEAATQDEADSGSAGASEELSPAVEEFCGAYTSILDELGSVDSGDTPEEQAAAGIGALKAWGRTLADADVPDEMPDDAADGLEVIVSTIEDLDDDATLAELSALDGSFSGPDRKASEAFTAWTTDQCPLDIPGGALP